MSSVGIDRSAEIFQVLSDRVIHGHDVYMTRNNLMLAISTGMVAILFTSTVPESSRMIFKIFGGLVALTWVAMNFFSLRWIEFWENELQSFERNLSGPHVFGEYNE